MKPPIKLYQEPKLKSPLMVAAWPGMGHVAIGAVEHLKNKLGAQEFGEIEPFDFFDPAGVIIEDSVIQPPKFPDNKFYYWKGQGTELIIFLGEAQPSKNGYQYAHRVLDVAQRFKVTRLFTAAAAPASIYHREKPSVWAVVNDSQLVGFLNAYDVVMMGGGHIGGMNGLILGVAAERGIGGACLLGEIPYYAVGVPNPKSSQAVLEVLTQMLGIEVDLSEIELLARDAEEQIDKLIASSEQMAKLVDRFTGREQAGGMPESVEDEIRIRHKIEKLFEQAEKDRSKAAELKAELDKLGVFEEYEDRFLNLFRKENL